MFLRAVEIPCPTCLTWSHSIQDMLEFSIYLYWEVNSTLDQYFKLDYFKLVCCLENSADLKKPADLDIRCFHLRLDLVSYGFQKRLHLVSA